MENAGKVKMKINILQNDFLTGLQIVARALPKKTNIPIFSGIFIETEKDKIHLFATDLESGIDYYSSAEIIEKGKIVLPGRLIYNLVKSLPEGNIEIETEDSIAILKEDGSEYKIIGYSAEDFPVFPEIEGVSEITIEEKNLKEAISQTIFAISKDESRPLLTGLSLKIKDNKLILAGTDGRRLAIKTIYHKGKNIEIIIPREILIELHKLLDDGEAIIRIGNKQILFILTDKGVRIYSRLLEGNFPDIDKIVPKEFSTTIIVNANELRKKLERIFLFTGEFGEVKFEIKETIILKANNKNKEGIEYIDCKKEGNDLEIFFNCKYILDFLNEIKNDTILMKLNSSLNPAVISPEIEKNYYYVLMPRNPEK